MTRHGIREGNRAACHIGKRVDHPVGHAEHDIQIAQTAVAVNQQHFAAKLRESRAYARCKGSFSCAALTGRNKNHLQHTASERKPYLRQYCINLQIRLQVYYKLTAGGLQAFHANFLTKTSNGTGFGKKKPGKITFAGLRLPRNCSFAYNCFIESGCSPPDGRLRGPTCRQRNTHRAYHARSAQRKRRGLRLHRPRR